jgi:hypothetical protein
MISGQFYVAAVPIHGTRHDPDPAAQLRATWHMPRAINAMQVLSTRKVVIRRQELGWHFFYGVRSLRRCVVGR